MSVHPTDADARFVRTTERRFRERIGLEPVVATFLGIHDHDAEMQSASREQVEALTAFHRATVDEMERFTADELSPDHRLDRDLAIHQSRLALHELTERRSWEKRAGAAEEIGEALFPLFTRDFAPFDERLASIAGRLEAAPQLLAEAQQRVTDPVRLIALSAHVGRAIYDGESADLGLLRGSSAFSPALRKLEQEFEKIRFEMQEERVRRLFDQGRQRPGLVFDEARRILWMYTSREVYRMLVRESGWSPDRYQEWLSQTLLEALVAP